MVQLTASRVSLPVFSSFSFFASPCSLQSPEYGGTLPRAPRNANNSFYPRHTRIQFASTCLSSLGVLFTCGCSGAPRPHPTKSIVRVTFAWVEDTRVSSLAESLRLMQSIFSYFLFFNKSLFFESIIRIYRAFIVFTLHWDNFRWIVLQTRENLVLSITSIRSWN